jgi:WD40 repeat protein
MRGGLAAAAVALTLPGFRLFHQGQLEGRRLRLPVQLGRRHPEPAEPGVQSFYRRLLAELSDPVFHDGEWRLLEPREAWSGNSSYQNFVAYSWIRGDEYRLVIVNIAPDKSQCHLPVGFPALAGEIWELRDMLSDRQYPRSGEELQSPGLYLDLEGYDYHLFRLFQVQPYAAAPLRGIELRCTFQEHEQDIYGVAWSPDGRLLASGGKERTILVWAAEDGRRVHSLRGHQQTMGALAWSPDGQMLASGSDDNTIRIWEVATETAVMTLRSHWNSVLSVAWSPNGQMLASGSVDHQVILWDIKTARPSHAFAEHTDAVNCVVWSPNGRILASASGDTTIRLWDIQSHALHRMLKGGSAWISSIAWSPDGRILAAGLGSGSVDIWDVESGRQLAILQGHTTKVLCVAFSYDGRLLVSKSADDTVRFWRSDTWVGLTPPLPEHGEYLSGLAYHPKGHVLATRDDRENVIHVWDLDLQQLATARVEAIRYTTARIVLTVVC